MTLEQEAFHAYVRALVEAGESPYPPPFQAFVAGMAAERQTIKDLEESYKTGYIASGIKALIGETQ